jgi:multiple sugar transport system substrate-binding protein
MTRFLHLCIITGVLLLTGCQVTPQTDITPTFTAAPSTPTLIKLPEATPTSSTTTLRIWLPPQFSPDAHNQSGALLKARLDEFASRRPGVQIEIREKSEDGAASLINSLVATSAAAPEAVPDLIALPQSQLQVAVLKGLLHPYDGLTEIIDDKDWYDYAYQLGRLQNSTFGLPFAGDALILVYRSSINNPPVSFTDFLSGTNSMVFPAGDAEGLFPLNLYLASGGSIYDEQGKLVISPGPLTTTLTFFDQSIKNHLMPSWITQLQNDEQSWQALTSNRTKMAVTWTSRYYTNLNPEYSATIIPTPDGEPFTLATGWVWALANPHRGDQTLAVELAEYLSDTDFQTEWSMASGYLPTRKSALGNWQDESLKLLSERIIESAHIITGTEDITRLTSIFYKATLSVLQGESDPNKAANEAMNSINQP